MGARKKVILGVVVAFGLFVILLLLALNRVTPVEHEEAVRRFHEERKTIGQHPKEEPAPATKARAKDRPGRAQRVSAAPDEAPGSTPSVAVVPSGATTEKQDPAKKAEEAEPEPWPVMPVVVRPAEGVYTYRTDGHEGFEGIFDREFPPVSYRTIIHTGERTWSDHTIFSEERESWSSFVFTQGQRRVPSQRNRIRFAAYERDETVTFEPPLLSTMYPWELGRTWRGTFSGETYGSFEAETAHREYVTVGTERVPAWGDRLDVELHGRIEGEVTVTRWLSPEHGLTLREEYRADAYLGPLHYIAEWSVTLRSVRPSV
jgi:hypothetical protein